MRVIKIIIISLMLDVAAVSQTPTPQTTPTLTELEAAQARFDSAVQRLSDELKSGGRSRTARARRHAAQQAVSRESVALQVALRSRVDQLRKASELAVANRDAIIDAQAQTIEEQRASSAKLVESQKLLTVTLRDAIAIREKIIADQALTIQERDAANMKWSNMIRELRAMQSDTATQLAAERKNIKRRAFLRFITFGWLGKTPKVSKVKM